MRWWGFKEEVFGDGQITYYANNSAVRLSSYLTSGGNNRAAIYLTLPAYPGVTYTIQFSARITAGFSEESTRPFFGVDYPEGANLQHSLALSEQWESYTLSFTVPFDATPGSDPGIVPGVPGINDSVLFALGVFSGNIGEVELTRPLVFSTGVDITQAISANNSDRDFSNYRFEWQWFKYPNGTMEYLILARETRTSEGNVMTTFDLPEPFFPVSESKRGHGIVAIATMDSQVPDIAKSINVTDIQPDQFSIRIDRTTSTETYFYVRLKGWWRDPSHV